MSHNKRLLIIAAFAVVGSTARAELTNDLSKAITPEKSKAAAIESGTNIGNGTLKVDVQVNGQSADPATVQVTVSRFASRANRQSVIQWCSDKIGIIRDIREAAGIAKLGQASRMEVIGIYERGFDQLNEGFGEIQGAYSLTQRAIVRGKEISEALANSLVDGERDLTTRVHFLENYYNFIERVAREVDIPYYIPYLNRGGCKDCDQVGVSEEAFGIKLLENARDQLKMVLERMATQDRSGAVFPQGVPRGFLTVLEFATKNAAEDLQETLLYTRMACVIGELNGLSAKLARYNSGATAEYGGRDDLAVRLSYGRANEQLREVRAAIDSYARYNCDRSNRGGYIQPEPGHGHDRNRDDRAYPLPPFVTPEGVQRR